MLRMNKCFLAILLVVTYLLCSCGGGGGGGSKGSGNGSDHYKTVKLHFNISSKDGSVSNKTISANGTNPLPDAKYYYKATPKWSSKDPITGATNGFVVFDPVTFSHDFALGNWAFEIQIRTNTTNNYVLYETALVNSAIPVTTVNSGTTAIEVTVEKKHAGTGTIDVDIYAPTVAEDGKVTFKYGKIGGTEYSVMLDGVNITEGEYNNYTRFTGHLTNVPAGLYLFHAIYEYTYVDNENVTQTVDIDNENIAYGELFGDGTVTVTGTIEGNQNVTASFTIKGISTLGVTVKSVKSTSDDTEVPAVIKAGGSLIFKAIPTEGTSNGWITYETPDTYQWYLNGDPVATGPYYTFITEEGTVPNTSYVYCLASKKNADNIVEYAAGAGMVIIVKP